VVFSKPLRFGTFLFRSAALFFLARSRFSAVSSFEPLLVRVHGPATVPRLAVANGLIVQLAVVKVVVVSKFFAGLIFLSAKM